MTPKLNLGSYTNPLPDFINVDIEKWPGVDEIVDLNKLPWPWPDGVFHEVRALDIIEHLGKLTKVEIVAELARITSPGGKVTVRVPTFFHPTSLQSLQHAHTFYLDSFENNYAQPHFEVLARSVSFTYLGREFPFVFPIRFILRIAGRLGLLHTMTVVLKKPGCPDCHHENGYHSMECQEKFK